MLKITEIYKDEEAVTLKLDGKLVDVWVSNLKELCLYYKDKGRTVVLDFSGVSFIDGDGLNMLEEVKDERIEIVNCSPFIEMLLRDLANNNKGNRGKASLSPDRGRR